MRPRFSLRSLLILLTFAALACAWLVIPSRNAEQLVNAIDEGDYSAADDLFRGRHKVLQTWSTQPYVDTISSELLDQTLSDVAFGRRRIWMAPAQVHQGEENGVEFHGTTFKTQYIVHVNAFGATVPQAIDDTD